MYARLLFIFASVILVSLNVSAAVTYTQRVGENYLAFEAEEYSSLTRLTGANSNGFMIVNSTTPITTAYGTNVLPLTTNASGNSAIIDNPLGGGSYTADTKVTYSVTFQTAGTYNLYARTSVFETSAVGPPAYGNEDSFFVYDSFDMGTRTLLQPGISTTYTEGTFGWSDTGLDFIVTAGQVGTVLTFEIQDRELGAAFDRFAFSTTAGLGQLQLDSLINAPEPGRAMLLMGGLAALLFRRSRK